MSIIYFIIIQENMNVKGGSDKPVKIRCKVYHMTLILFMNN